MRVRGHGQGPALREWGSGTAAAEVASAGQARSRGPLNGSSGRNILPVGPTSLNPLVIFKILPAKAANSALFYLKKSDIFLDIGKYVWEKGLSV